MLNLITKLYFYVLNLHKFTKKKNEMWVNRPALLPAWACIGRVENILI